MTRRVNRHVHSSVRGRDPEIAALTTTERLSALAHIVTSLEFLARPQDQRVGGPHDWTIARELGARPSGVLGALADVVADEAVERAIDIVRIAAASSLLLPARMTRYRMAADLLLGLTTLARYPKRRLGSDGSDQLAFIVQMLCALGRVTPNSRRLALDALAAQGVLAYTSAGFSKLAGPRWRSGDALHDIMGTRSLGDARMFAHIRLHPRLSRLATRTVVATEALMPVVLLAPRRASRIALASMAFFHLANARWIGLGRFALSFVALYPAIDLVAQGRRGAGHGR